MNKRKQKKTARKTIMSAIKEMGWNMEKIPVAKATIAAPCRIIIRVFLPGIDPEIIWDEVVKTSADLESRLETVEKMAGNGTRRIVEITDSGDMINIVWEDPVFNREGWFEITKVPV